MLDETEGMLLEYRPRYQLFSEECLAFLKMSVGMLDFPLLNQDGCSIACCVLKR